MPYGPLYLEFGAGPRFYKSHLSPYPTYGSLSQRSRCCEQAKEMYLELWSQRCVLREVAPVKGSAIPKDTYSELLRRLLTRKLKLKN